ncbi:hypothetical protein WJX81_002066 [Elliptochloris bilobata]|uniref:Ketoreductase domain-containing protein n=1 Tax=Elliptochloris bilobata TaxID=381761 RepID=A0AAW1QL40_9CHLO
MVQVAVVTGTSRGIGLEFTRQLLAREPRVRVVAAARRPAASQELAALQRQHGPAWLTLVALDLASQESIQAAAEEVACACPDGVDILINNAGVLGSHDLASETTSEDLEAVLRVNVIGTLALTRALLPLLRKGASKTVVNLSSGAGAISAAGGQGGWALRSLAYKSSKAALNMATVLLARELRPEGFIVVPVTPGWVATDLGNSTADLAGPLGPRPTLDAAASVRQMLTLLERLRPEDSGAFVNYDGRRLEW